MGAGMLVAFQLSLVVYLSHTCNVLQLLAQGCGTAFQLVFSKWSLAMNSLSGC